MLDGSKSYDSDGNPITYSWRQIEGPAVKLDDATTISPSFTAPNVFTDRKMVFELTVKDNDGLKNTSTVIITDKYNVPVTTSPISPPPYPPPINPPPIAIAGQDQMVTSGNKVPLDGSKSDAQKNGTITKYSWNQVMGPSVFLNNMDTATPSFTAPNVSNDTLLLFSLTVKDDKGVSSNLANVTIFVKPFSTSSLNVKNNTSSTNNMSKTFATVITNSTLPTTKNTNIIKILLSK